MADPQRSCLTIQGGPLGGRIFVLPDGHGRGTIGSDPSSNILVPLPGVSARHAVLVRRREGTFVSDQGSQRGTFVNGDKVAGERELRDGDLLWLGPPSDADSLGFKCRLLGAQPQPDPQPQSTDDFFVGDGTVEDGGAAGAPPDAPPAALAGAASEGPPEAMRADEGFFVSDSAAVAPAAPETPSDAFFVGDATVTLLGGTGEAAASAPAATETAAQEAPTPAADDDFFVAGEAEGAQVSAVPGAPATAPAALPAPAPAPEAAPVAAKMTSGATERAAPPAARPVSSRPTIVPTPTQGSVGVRPGTATPGARGIARPSASVGRPRTAVGGRPGAARAGVRRGGSGAPGWLWPVLGLLALVAAGAGGYSWLFVVGRPRVASIEPSQVRIGDKVVITGEQLGSSSEHAMIYFGDQPAKDVSGDASRVETKVPDMGLTPGERREVPVTVRVGRKQSAPVTVVVRKVPKISALSLEVAVPGEELLVAGEGWGASGVVVLFETAQAPVLEVSPAYVRVRVPDLGLPYGSSVRVVVVSGQDRSDAATLILGRLPVITSVEPRAAGMGDRIVIRGRGLRGTLADNTVQLGGVPVLVVAAADGQIEVLVPAQLPAGEATLQVHVRGLGNPALSGLTVTAPADPVALHFSAEPAAGGTRAAIGTALGAVFVLASSGGRSAAERAAEAVQRLNAAATLLRGRGEGGVELRLGPTSAVIALSGAAEPLLEVTNEDAAGYGRGKGPAVTRARLASWWLAELRDLTLLLGRGERPRNTAAFGREASALADLYEAALRAGAGNGVSRAVVGGMRPSVREGLVAMATRVPAGVPEPRP